MAMQQVEYTFPEPDEKDTAAEVEVETQEKDDDALEIEGAVGREDMKKPEEKPKVIKAGDLEIEIEDDRPPEDRGHLRAKAPKEVSDDELSEYSANVQKRIKSIQKSYHDERRDKERAYREREALQNYAKQLMEENERLKGSETRSHNALIQHAQKQVESELVIARRQYKDAYDSGDSEAIIAAQEALNSAQIKSDRVAGLKPRALQSKEKPVEQQPTNQESEKVEQPQEVRDERAEAWRDDNPWFGSDDEMTAFALGYHSKLVKEGVDPTSDDYYEKINSRMRRVFPEQFDSGEEEDFSEPEETPKKKPSNVVAPATRSTASKKVRLKQSEIAIARKLNVPLEQYALQAAKLRGNSNG
jgi:hypothetical protein